MRRSVLFLYVSLAALPADAAIPASEREALIALFNSTSGSDWIDNANWNGAAGTECTWAGVQCDAEQSTVIGIFLRQNNLSGTLPAEIGAFPNLTDLALWENALTGPLPSEIGTLTSLKRLVIDNNRFSGMIPSSIGNLANLEFFAAAGNELGAIPSEIGNLPKIESIRLGVNFISSIPPEMANLTTLTNLELHQNALTGPIPPELGNLTSLQSLNLSINGFTGSIPKELGNLGNLYFLSLDANLLSGPIPDELGTATELGWLLLSRNALSGQIPSTFQQLTNLHHLELFSNQLTGSIPATLGTLSSLEVLRLGDNDLTGSLPPSLGDLANLVVLTVGGNELTGTLPRELGQLTRLVALSFESNAISGALPLELTNLLELEELIGFENQLSGRLPEDLGTLTKMRVILLGDNRISGTIPSSITSLREMTSLGLQGNELTGSIPSDIGTLGNLENLWLFGNRLTGPISPSISDLSLLRSLRLDQNDLSGTIPSSLETLTQLEELLLNDNRLSGVIPPEIAMLTTLHSLAIGSNLLTGQIPSSLGDLENLIYLDLSNNDFRGDVPTSLLSLEKLTDDLSDFRYNALRTNDPQLRQFLNQKQDGGDWESTQTVEPANVRIVSTTDRTAVVGWDPIAYSFDPGGYRVSVSTSSSPPVVVATTAYKVDDSILIRGLSPSTTYRFVVRTVTHPHGLQKNTIVSDPSSAVTGSTTAAVILPAEVSVVRFPEGLVQRAGVAQNQDSFVLANRGDLSTAVDLSRVGDFFTQMPVSFTLDAGATRRVTLSSEPRPEGVYEGESVPTGDAVPSGLTIPVKLLSSGTPAGAPKGSADQNRISTGGEKGTTSTGQVTFQNTGTATLSGFLVSDVAWIIAPDQLIVIPPGESRTITFTIDRTKRPDAATNGEGSLSGTLRLSYLDQDSSGLSSRHVAAQTTGVSSTLVTIIDTSKPTVTPSGIPTLGAGEIALFIPGVTRSIDGGHDLSSGLSIVNSFGTSPLQDLRLYFSEPGASQAKVADVQSLSPTQSLSYASVVDGVYELGESSGTIQLRSQRAQSVLTDAVLRNDSAANGLRSMTMPILRSDRGIAAGFALTLPGTRDDDGLETEIYIQELSGNPATAVIKFVDASGNQTGPMMARDIPAFGFTALSGAVPAGTVVTVIRNEEGSPGSLGAWARLVDSQSGDIWAVTDWARVRAFDDGRAMRFPVISSDSIASERKRPVRRPGSGTEDVTIEPSALSGGRTELVLTNSGTSAASVVIRFYGSSETASEMTVFVDAGHTIVLPDVTAAHGRGGATGQLVIEPLSGRFSASARFVRDAGSGGSIGATIPIVSDSSGMRLGQFVAVPFIDDATRSHSEERLAGTRRTDVGLMESSGSPVKVRISVKVFDGSRLASAIVHRDFAVGPRELLYVRNISSAIIGPERDVLFGDLKDLQLELQVIEGEGAVTPFVVTVENGSGDTRVRME